MDLFTRCPKCETVFRVTTRHLQASGGQVRCGRCHSVFDAFASLTAKPPGESQRRTGPEEVQPPERESEATSINAQESGAPAGPESATQTDAQSGSTSTLTQAPSTQMPLAMQGDSAASNQLRASKESPVQEREDGANEPAAPAVTQRKRKKRERESEAPANLFEWEFKAAPTMRRTGLWLSLSLLLLIGAVAQAGYIFRTDLMIRYPQLQPVYLLACDWLSCKIELPRLADQLNIDASDLQLVDPSKPNIVQLTALVRNRAGVPVEYPAFELTLTNAQQQVVARRIFMPVDYLDDPARASAGLGGHQELAVNLYLDTGSLRAAGYRIYLFYPPPA